MRPLLVATVLLCCFCLSAGEAGAQSVMMKKYHVSALGGESLPKGDLAHNFSSNSFVGVSLQYQVRKEVAIGLRVMYHVPFSSKGDPDIIPALINAGWTLEYSNVTTRIIPLEVYARYYFSSSRTQPFLQAAAGIYHRSLTVKATYVDDVLPQVNQDLSRTDAGVSIGCGMEVALQDYYGGYLGADFHFLTRTDPVNQNAIDFPTGSVRFLTFYIGGYYRF